MNDCLSWSARDLITRLQRRELPVQSVVQACIERIEAAEPGILAWQHFDAAQALAQARALDAGATRGSRHGLHGLPIGVKDLMDTSDMPTTYGSPIYAGYRPAVDAACVAMARSAGAVIMGKTVTTEFATFQPGPTRNPRAPLSVPRTPGGSSSGSAAAVAAGMVPVAFGTQTAGSIIRPAAYCGVVGYKPTHGTLPLAGIKPLSPSLDTVGALARSVDDAAFFVGTLARLPLPSLAPLPQGRPSVARLRVALCHTPYWDRATGDTRQALATAARLLEHHGARLTDLSLPAHFSALNTAQIDIMAYEAAAAFAPERRTAADRFSSAFAAVLAQGQSIDGEHYFGARIEAHRARHALDAMFADFDVILAPSTEGVAPEGLQGTGDPVFNRMWTLLGNPCVHVPVGAGQDGMPVGVTLVGRAFRDTQLLAAAHALECSLA
ncbi:amidase [Corticibacter populi]|uniref:Amidase n=1 Tax=Corticibacter populi TaxID=1550736 RepID=A0A3M6QMG6_9BURK|nr:amidase [Corticibacter populi]RMX04278.1 amidase [Corticibacter populi]RZS33323.1 amidase [Corticibacter populi]